MNEDENWDDQESYETSLKGTLTSIAVFAIFLVLGAKIIGWLF